MTHSLLAHLPAARRRWAKSDRRLYDVVRTYPPQSAPLEGGDAFHSLVQSIAHQQVSLAAGRTIMGRVETACGGRVAPDTIQAAGPDRLRAAGLSRPKALYVLDLAERVADGRLPLADFGALPDDAIIEALTEVKGIGVWSAKMHLLFHLGRTDVLPFEDLGLQIAVARLYRVPRARAREKMIALGPAWSPYASLAAVTLWQWRRATEGPKTPPKQSPRRGAARERARVPAGAATAARRRATARGPRRLTPRAAPPSSRATVTARVAGPTPRTRRRAAKPHRPGPAGRAARADRTRR
ncbi:MAG: DNA-3-methyladenine glycosylase family protein [Thermoplasmatota archaeon]